ncbi:Pentatricopeptide repeat-containing protein [Vitis vinifera]|uniref:Pentatricopeptide repeat-containing protein n=1 Tax=Vitis vinifera TaxID=29760 RepID=A0A438K735_VITVI|nr:Pentatricopeptide repeat-containing protein [Vitis vinifera]
MDHTRFILDQTPSPTDFSWNSLIRAYTLHDSPQNSKSLFNLRSVFEEMCCKYFCLDSTQNLWVDMEFRDEVSWHSIRTCILKCGDVEKAWRIFDGVSCKKLPSWNAIISEYAQCGLLEEAIDLYCLMKAQSVKLNEIMLVNVLSACAGLGALELGRETSEKDVALWNAMILGLAYHGDVSDSLVVFSQMERTGVQPNDVTFIGVLSACNHSGLVEEGRVQFSSMADKHGLSPKLEHCACMLDLLGRAGHLKEAYELVQNMEGGRTLLELGDRFVVEDTTHLKSQEIYSTYEILIDHLKAEGYVLNSGFSWRY